MLHWSKSQIKDGRQTPSWITETPTQRMIKNHRFWTLGTFKQLSWKNSFLEFFSISSPFFYLMVLGLIYIHVYIYRYIYICAIYVSWKTIRMKKANNVFKFPQGLDISSNWTQKIFILNLNGMYFLDVWEKKRIELQTHRYRPQMPQCDIVLWKIYGLNVNYHHRFVWRSMKVGISGCIHLGYLLNG